LKERLQITCTVNGSEVTRWVDARQHLVDFLRVDLGLTGSHIGCEHGVCGACTVRVDGAAVRGCLMLAVQANGAKVETIEGLSDSKEIADLQQAFLERNAAQCAFCSAGILITVAELLSQPNNLSRDEIREFLSGNYCRCTGYHTIVDAIEDVQKQRSSSPD